MKSFKWTHFCCSFKVALFSIKPFYATTFLFKYIFSFLKWFQWQENWMSKSQKVIRLNSEKEFNLKRFCIFFHEYFFTVFLIPYTEMILLKVFYFFISSSISIGWFIQILNLLHNSAYFVELGKILIYIKGVF